MKTTTTMNQNKTSIAPESAQHTRLRWACRRGMLELDYILLAVVENAYDHFSDAEQRCFQRLLAENDQDLFDWLLGQRVPENDEYRALCEKIRSIIITQ